MSISCGTGPSADTCVFLMLHRQNSFKPCPEDMKMELMHHVCLLLTSFLNFFNSLAYLLTFSWNTSFKWRLTESYEEKQFSLVSTNITAEIMSLDA